MASCAIAGFGCFYLAFLCAASDSGLTPAFWIALLGGALFLAPPAILLLHDKTSVDDVVNESQETAAVILFLAAIAASVIAAVFA